MRARNRASLKAWIRTIWKTIREHVLVVLVVACSVVQSLIFGNLLIIILIQTDPQLHTPMYFFLKNLSFVDLCFSTSIVPQMLVHFLVKKKTISFAGCSLQIVVFLLAGCTECALLAMMSYDRYVAVCRPLHYSTLMTHRVCVQHRMEHWNSTLGSGFILMGILNDSLSPELICATVTVLYTLALTSNGFLLLAITMDARLHVPMYLLLGQLSLMDLLFTSVVTPKAFVDYLLSENTISFGGCALQMFLALTLGGAEDLLLAFMAYDRYVAIC
ncbi:hypothetical protein K5549_018097, partial [Capra hircus]